MTSEYERGIATSALMALVANDQPGLDAHPGYAQAKRYFPTFFAPFAGLSMTVVDQLAEGEKVATRFQLSGTHSAEFVGVAATGRVITFDAFSIDRVEGDVVTEHNATADLIGILAQLGVITPRPIVE